MYNALKLTNAPQFKLLVGEITSEKVKALISSLTTFKPTILMIDSAGGDLEVGTTLMGSIRNNTHVMGIVVGKVNSMAIPVFESCSERVMLDTATMFFHAGMWSATMSNLAVFDPDLLDRWVEEKRQRELAYDKMVLAGVKHDQTRAEEFQLNLETIRNWRLKELTLTANQALKYGLCDKVVSLQELIASELYEKLLF